VDPPEAPVERHVVVQQDVAQAALGAVLRYYGNVRHLHTATDELTEVRVIELPRGGGRERETVTLT